MIRLKCVGRSGRRAVVDGLAAVNASQSSRLTLLPMLTLEKTIAVTVLQVAQGNA
jgi:hypothetical protein